MHIVICHDELAADARADELDVLDQVRAVEQALHQLGHRTSTLPVSLNLQSAADSLRANQPDLIFNLVESINRQGRLIHLAPALFESLDIPFTGAGSAAVFATSNKLTTKTLLRAADLPTPDWTSHQGAEHGRTPAGDRWIIKSVWEHASLGLGDDSIVRPMTASQLQRELEQRAPALGGECFAEQFIEGREFNIALLASAGDVQVLPPAEIVFEQFAAAQPRIVGYKAKWETESHEYVRTPRRFDFPAADDLLLGELRVLAQRCWSHFNLRGYARVDFRVDETGQPWILEVNINPCISPDAGFAAALNQAAIPFRTGIDRILKDADRTP